MTNKIDMAWFMAEKQHQGQDYGPFTYMKHIKDCDVIFDELWSYANWLVNDELGHEYYIQDYLTDEEYIIVKASVRLHDSLEDGRISYNDIKLYFGVEIADTVYGVTDDTGRNRTERKNYARIKENRFSRIVKIIDRIANVTESKLTGSSMFKKYIKEYAGFKENISVQDPCPFEQLCWNRLNELLNK